jgi:hypothetical protein
LYIVCVLSAVTSVGALVGLIRLSRIVAALAKARSPSSDAAMRAYASQVSSLAERLNELQPAVEGLLNREKMRRVRTGARITGEPDPHSDPAAWKAHMRRNKALGG